MATSFAPFLMAFSIACLVPGVPAPPTEIPRGLSKLSVQPWTRLDNAKRRDLEVQKFNERIDSSPWGFAPGKNCFSYSSCKVFLYFSEDKNMDLDLEGQPQFEWVFLSRSPAEISRAMEKERAVQPPISRMIQPTPGRRMALTREQPFWDPDKTPVPNQAV